MDTGKFCMTELIQKSMLKLKKIRLRLKPLQKLANWTRKIMREFQHTYLVYRIYTTIIKIKCLSVIDKYL